MRYFLGYNLAGSSADLVDRLRQSIGRRFDVQSALRIPPHLTLFYPFEWDEGVERLENVLVKFAERESAFINKISGFGHFGEEVWFIDVEQNAGLFDLKKRLDKVMVEQFNLDENNKGHSGIHFHITLAYKDVTPEKFKLIGEYLSLLDVPIEEISINALTLFELQGDEWKACAEFKFKS